MMVIIATILQGHLMCYFQKKFPGHASLSDLEIQKKDCDGMVWKTVKNNRLDRTFTVKKVKSAFAHMGSYKSAGPDGFKPIIMKISVQKHLRALITFFKLFIQLDIFQLNFVNQKWFLFQSL